MSSALLNNMPILTGDADDVFFERKDWHCPWGSTVIDDVVPEFRLILEGIHSTSMKSSDAEDTNERRHTWWVLRKNLDRRLGNLLK